MRYQFIKEQEKAYPVKRLCNVMQVSRSAYYEWRMAKHLPNIEERVLKNKLQGVFERRKKT